MFEKFRVTQHERRIRAFPILTGGMDRVLWRGNEEPTPEVIDELVQQTTSGVSEETIYVGGMAVQSKEVVF